MKKLTYLVLLLTIGFYLNSCSDDAEFTKNLNFVSFEGGTTNVVVEKNSSASLEIKVYTTQFSGTDRTFTLKADTDASTVDPGAYTIPTSVTVPANSNVGSFSIGISDVNIGDSGETLVIGLVSEDGLFTGKNITVNIQRLCTFNINDFLGEYIITEEGYGDYATTITLDPDVPNRIWITNFWDWTADLAYYDFDPVNGTVTMPEQVLVMGDGEGYTCVGSGTYNACAGTFHMEYDGDVAGTVHDFNPAGN